MITNKIREEVQEKELRMMKIYRLDPVRKVVFLMNGQVLQQDLEQRKEQEGWRVCEFALYYCLITCVNFFLLAVREEGRIELSAGFIKKLHWTKTLQSRVQA